MRLSHGRIVSAGPEQPGTGGASAPPASASIGLHEFDYLFPTLQEDADALLPEHPTTAAGLRALGATMVDPVQPGEVDVPGNSPIPAVYTYFGQFVDHDITLEKVTEGVDLGDPALAPLPLAQVRDTLHNTRTATLDLDSVYDPPAPLHPQDPAKLLVGDVTPLGGTAPPVQRPPGKLDDNDLPRRGRDATDQRLDREALTGDPRNDENTIIGQLHVAFLKAHNRLVDEGRTLEEARRILRQHYQHVVVHDYLPRICDPAVVGRVVRDGNRWFNPFAEPFSMPLEFSAAAFRFGHTMVRAGYDFNVNFNIGAGGVPASLSLLFTFSALSGQLGFGSEPPDGSDTLPDNWIVQWENLAGEAVPDGGRARRFDTRLAGPAGESLFGLRDEAGATLPGLGAMLSARNLLRGYLLRMPTGQAVAQALGITPLGEQELRDAVGEDQFAVLQEHGFVARTPLWFYVLAEAAARAGGAHLGPVGSTIVAEVLVGLVRRSADSVLRIAGWRPSMPSLRPGTFELADLLRYAEVLDGGAPPHLHTVAAGDTLSGIAQAQLGDASRWPEVFASNRAVVADPHRILPGQVLSLPQGPPVVPQLRFHVVGAGETLSGIARDHLGDATRWPEVFVLNGGVLTSPDVIVVGQVLQLPSK